MLYARFLCLIGFFASCSKIYEKLFFDLHQVSCESMLACAKATFAMGEKFTTQIVCFVFFTAILFGSIENLEKIKKVLSLKKHDRSLICICSLFYIPIVFYLSKNPWAFFCILAYLIVKLFEIYLKPSRDNLCWKTRGLDSCQKSLLLLPFCTWTWFWTYDLLTY